jgi:hypothetical protein
MTERTIERKFFHDLLNLASSMRGIAEVIRDEDENTRSEMLLLMGNISESMIETINAQRHYRSVVTKDLTLLPSHVDCEKLLTRMADTYNRHTLCQHKTIEIRPSLQTPRQTPICLFTDKDVLQGALGYGIRTALETITNENTVTLSLITEEAVTPHAIVFLISFPGTVSEQDRAAIFKNPETDTHAMTGLSAYLFYTLITDYLKGSVTWTTHNGSIQLSARFHQQMDAR